MNPLKQLSEEVSTKISTKCPECGVEASFPNQFIHRTGCLWSSEPVLASTSFEEPEACSNPNVYASKEAQVALDAGLESAKRGEIKPWGDFTKYAVEDEDDA